MSVFECELVFVCVREYLRVFASAHRVMEASAGYKREGILSFQSITITNHTATHRPHRIWADPL